MTVLSTLSGTLMRSLKASYLHLCVVHSPLHDLNKWEFLQLQGIHVHTVSIWFHTAPVLQGYASFSAATCAVSLPCFVHSLHTPHSKLGGCPGQDKGHLWSSFSLPFITALQAQSIKIANSFQDFWKRHVPCWCFCKFYVTCYLYGVVNPVSTPLVFRWGVPYLLVSICWPFQYGQL